MGRYAIAAYRPKPGKEVELMNAVRDHLPTLRSEGLVTDRPPYVMKAADGTIVEIFEWKSPAAIRAAHDNPIVLQLWQRFEAACEYRQLDALDESHQMFAEFEALEIT